MIRPRLVNYIKEQLNRGHDIVTIKNHLLKHGYDIATINENIAHIYSAQREVKHVVHLSKGTMLFIAGFIIFIVLTGFLTYFYLKPFKPAKQLLDLKIDILTHYIKPGEVLKFNIELSNLGIVKRYDVFLIHEVLDTTSKLITSKEETIAVETRTSSKSEIKIPINLKQGSYIIKTTARYNGKIATATDIFNVVKESIEPGCFDGIQNQNEISIDCGGICKPCEEEKKCPLTCNDNNICTRDYCNDKTNFLCVNEQIKSCCGNDLCELGESTLICNQDCKEQIKEKLAVDLFEGLSIFEKINKIKEIAKTNPEIAGEYCSEIEQEIYRNDCFSDLAE